MTTRLSFLFALLLSWAGIAYASLPKPAVDTQTRLASVQTPPVVACSDDRKDPP